MRAARVRATSPDGTPYGVPHHPAPSSAIEVHDDIPKPQVSQPDELLIQVKASTVIRDNLEWNELYPPNHALLGNDFAGIIVDRHQSVDEYNVGDHVYGMSHGNRGGMWAEYAVVTTEEAVHKPDHLSWEEAAALPLSAMTADQAMFVHGGLELARSHPKSILITGASGGVGVYLVQFAVAAGHHVVAATSSRQRNEALLRSIGAHEVVEYTDFSTLHPFDLIVDVVGSQVLRDCWGVIKPDGTLISVDSTSWGFVDEHRRSDISVGKEGVRALFFIVEPSRQSMERISRHVLSGKIKGLVSKTVSLDDVRAAYESAHSRGIGQGKIVITP